MALLVGFVAGCATVANTPAQERGWERWNACARDGNMLGLDEIRPDGGIRFRYFGAVDVWALRACLRARAEEQSRRAGVDLPPEPEAVPRTGGGE